MKVNPMLLKLAAGRVWQQAAGQTKQAFQPPEGGGGAPAMGGGAPPMDPSMAGGAPGGVPPPGGAPPMGDASAMGAPPGSPGAAMMGGGGMMGGGMPGQPGMQGPQKLKPDQLMLMLDYRMYNLQQQMTAIMNALNIQLPPNALVMPPGQPGAPPAESALPGGPNDSTGQQQAAGGGDSAIKPIEPMQGASPEMAQAGGAPKQASWIGDMIARTEAPTEIPSSVGAAALAAIYRSRARAGVLD